MLLRQTVATKEAATGGRRISGTDSETSLENDLRWRSGRKKEEEEEETCSPNGCREIYCQSPSHNRSHSLPFTADRSGRVEKGRLVGRHVFDNLFSSGQRLKPITNSSGVIITLRHAPLPNPSRRITYFLRIALNLFQSQKLLFGTNFI